MMEVLEMMVLMALQEVSMVVMIAAALFGGNGNNDHGQSRYQDQNSDQCIGPGKS